MQSEIRSDVRNLYFDEESSKRVGLTAESHAKFIQEEDLLNQIDEKTREIEKLHVLVQSLAPASGDAEKYKKYIEGSVDPIDVDFRDSKIVELAKKCRKLTVSLNKERSQIESLKQALNDATAANENLRKEVENSGTKRTIAGKLQAAVVDDGSLQRDLTSANKTIEELRRKVTQTKEESRNLTR